MTIQLLAIASAILSQKWGGAIMLFSFGTFAVFAAFAVEPRSIEKARRKWRASYAVGQHVRASFLQVEIAFHKAAILLLSLCGAGLIVIGAYRLFLP